MVIAHLWWHHISMILPISEQYLIASFSILIQNQVHIPQVRFARSFQHGSSTQKSQTAVAHRYPFLNVSIFYLENLAYHALDCNHTLVDKNQGVLQQPAIRHKDTANGTPAATIFTEESTRIDEVIRSWDVRSSASEERNEVYLVM